MASSNLFQTVRCCKSQKGVPGLLSGVRQLLASLCPIGNLTFLGFSIDQATFALGQKIRQAPSEQAYVSQPETEAAQRAYNRFLQKVPAEDLFSLLISRLPEKFFSGPGTIWILDDTPLRKSGHRMEKAGKFHHNGAFFHGYELPVLVSQSVEGIFPLGFALKGKDCPSKIDFSKNLLEAALNCGFLPDFLVFDTWFTAVELLAFADEKNLRFVGPLKMNRILFLNGRKTSPKKLLKKLDHRTYQSFDVTLSNGRNYRLVTFRRLLSSGKTQVEFLLTNDWVSPPKIIAQAYLKRWGIETFFRSAKQSFALEKFHNRSWSVIQLHLAFTFCAMLLVAYLRSLFELLAGKSLAFVRTFGFFKRVRIVLKTSNNLSMVVWHTIPNPLYFKRFGLCS